MSMLDPNSDKDLVRLFPPEEDKGLDINPYNLLVLFLE